MSPEILEGMLKNSPLVVIILLILWQYRRDYSKVFEKSVETSNQLINLLGEAVAAIKVNTAIVESNKRATEENTAIIRKFSDAQKFRRNGP